MDEQKSDKDDDDLPRPGKVWTGPHPAKSGWSRPPNSRKAHYFDRSFRSLCLRWAWIGPRREEEEPKPEHCSECRRKLIEKQRAAGISP